MIFSQNEAQLDFRYDVSLQKYLMSRNDNRIISSQIYHIMYVYMFIECSERTHKVDSAS